MHGTALCDFLAWLAFHLATSGPGTGSPDLENIDLLDKFARMIFPALSVPDVKFPEELARWLPALGNLKRTCHEDMIDLYAETIGVIDGMFNIVSGEGEGKFHRHVFLVSMLQLTTFETSPPFPASQ